MKGRGHQEAGSPEGRRDTLLVGLMALGAGVVSATLALRQGTNMLYRDAMSHLAVARMIWDHHSWWPTWLGPNWLPLPHLLMVPFAWNLRWWQTGVAGAIPSTICFVATVVGMYRLSLRMMPRRWAVVTTAFLGLNANLLYLASTPMSEPLSIALEVWVALMTCALLGGLRDGDTGMLQRRLVLDGLLIWAAMMTRYESWILGSAIWALVTWKLWRQRKMFAAVRVPYAAFTVLVVLGPLLWFAFCKVYFGDWLNFWRGPASVRQQVLAMFPPGRQQYYGWHHPWQAFRLYLRTAQLTAVGVGKAGYVLSAVAALGSWAAWRGRVERAALVLWLPLPFHVYEISSGSLAMVLPDMGPMHFYMSVRYGSALLPALVLFSIFGLSRMAVRLRDRGRVRVADGFQRGALLLVATNFALMIYFVPLLLRDGLANAQARLLEQQRLVPMIAGAEARLPVMIDVWTTQIGMAAVQAAGRPLKETVGPFDGEPWTVASARPGERTALVVAVDGDLISGLVKAHPQGLQHVATLCEAELPCVQVYRPERYAHE